MDKNTPILVTGASGLIGSYLLRQLIQEGFTNVQALKRSHTDLSLIADIQHFIQWKEGDVLYIDKLEDAMEGVEKVYHCAAIVSYDSRDRKKLTQVNVEGTANVVNLCLEKGVKKLVYVSSIAAIGKDKNQNAINEKAKWNADPNLTHYAISKYLAEQEVWRGMIEGLDVAIVNPPIVLGFGNWEKSSTTLFKQVFDGLKFYPVGSTAFVDVKDVARFMVQLMESDVKNERFIVSGGNMSYKTLFELMAKNMNKPAPSIKVTPFIRGMAWRLEWLRSRITGKKVVITKETAHVSAQNYSFSNQKSIDFFNFQYTPLEKTIGEISEKFFLKETEK